AASDLYATPARRHWPHRFFVRRHGTDAGQAAEAVWIVVDAVDRVVIAGAFVADRDVTAALVAAAVPDNDGVMHLAPADAAWALLIHAGIKGRSLDLGSPLDALDTRSVLAQAIDARLGLGRAVDVVADLRT